MNNKVLVLKKNGYNVWAEVNPKTNRLFNFSASGVGINPNNTYPYLSDVEKVINRMATSKG